MDEVILNDDGGLSTPHGRLVDDALAVLGARLRLGEGCTLGAVGRMAAAHPVLQRLSPFAPDLAALCASGNAVQSPPSGLARMEFSRVVEVVGHPPPPRMDIYHVLRGVLSGGEDVEPRQWTVESLLAVPLVLGPLRHVVFGDRVERFGFETVCTLFELFQGVVWQLAFHCTPRACALRR
ncbi:hypothetical protein SAMN04488503_2891 [Humidesulfovibrio mexicanus]|uniref:Uncharacterized protein n=1 Tax=Humidesulfovibrio mexicanus TaxID=147047 RepID=A0A239C0K4_9BACT|nr:hypothetical protein [Humidesulfovibrio mexicanus]SNS13855.1 hypothetical protein SAMN04488503_2891 [Humidesulfovibrio mexicanus]